MMGLNNETNGAYYGKDADFSGKFKSKNERNKANLEVSKKRLKELGLAGYTKLLIKKTLINYNDGTFAWSQEGTFYKELYKDKNTMISPFLKECFYSNGKYYKITSTIQQTIWIGIIVSMLGFILLKKKNTNKEIAVLMLSIIGLTAFELLFEARARYLYIYAPIYICLGTIGIKSITYKIEAKLVKNKLKS